MCGRYTLISDISELQGRFGFVMEPPAPEPRYNIAPTQPVLTVVNDGARRGELMRWGLVPSWAKDIKIGARMINSVSETAATKPAFRSAFRRRRCLVLADGFLRVAARGKAACPDVFLPEVGRGDGLCRAVGKLAVAGGRVDTFLRRPNHCRQLVH